MKTASEHFTLRSAITQKCNVMTAVILRDMRTRFFNHGLGFLVVSLWPLAHMLAILAIFTLAGRAAPFGDSLNVFFATGLVPTLGFMYVSRFMAYSLVLNRPMLHFPVVKPLDVMTARAALECIAACLTVALMMTVLWMIGDKPLPDNVMEAFFAYASLLFLAFSCGILAGVIGMLFKPFIMIYSLSMILVYLFSGTLFVASNLPEQIAIPLSYNPVLVCVEWMRTAYFPTYSDRFVDREYVLVFALTTLCLGLGLERACRRMILEG